MPAYDYQCQACGEQFTRRVPVEERDRQACPRCGSERARRLLSFANILTGSQGSQGSRGACTTGFG